MALKPGLRLSQTQRLALTPGLRQSLHILGLSTAELTELIASEIGENPLLKQARIPRHDSGKAFDFAVETVAQQASAADTLRRQIRELTNEADLAQIAGFLASNLSEAGFLTDCDSDLADLLEVPLAKIRTAIHLLQSCEPAGIGARNLLDCLDIQLARAGEVKEVRKLLLDNLSHFATRDWSGLKNQTGLPKAELTRLASLLQALTPTPRSAIEPEQVQYLHPDVRVVPRPDGGLSVESLNPAVAGLMVDQKLLDKMAGASKTTDTYLADQTARARALIRAVRSRDRTILRVAREIVERQHRFFVHGPRHLLPMKQAELAVLLDLHPSTITRAIAHKALECSFGLFPLRFFFTTALRSQFGTPVSAYVVQQEIRRLITAETGGKTLSDARLVAILRQSGVDIARRTVAKYRQCLKLPSSVQRRRSKRPL
jgi:RNA polymerase sigma-54 factor